MSRCRACSGWRRGCGRPPSRPGPRGRGVRPPAARRADHPGWALLRRRRTCQQPIGWSAGLQSERAARAGRLVERRRAVGARAAVRVPVRARDGRPAAAVRACRLADRPDRRLRVRPVRSVPGGRAAARRQVSRKNSRGRITAALVGLVVLVLAGWFVREQVVDNKTSALPTQALSALPPETATTWRLAQQGGPFPQPPNERGV